MHALPGYEFDVTLTEAHKFDVYLAAHHQSALRALGFMLQVGFNIGFVGTKVGRLVVFGGNDGCEVAEK